MNRNRLVAVRASVKGKRPRVSSGCVIAPRLVLTAGHALQPQGAAMSAAHVQVHVQLFAVGRLVPARLVWDGRAAGLDAAVLQVAPEHWPQDAAEPPVRFGRFVTLRAGQPADALGFARVQGARRADGLETAQASGTVSPGDGMLGAHWELSVDRAPAGLDESPWSGMSGAALWSGRLLCGVVAVDLAHWRHGKLQAVPAHRLLREEGLRSLLTRELGYVPVAEAVELEALCEPAVPSRAPRLPSELLRPQAEAVPFAGRDRELREFGDWCGDGGGLATRLITGPGGQGKSRFARELSVTLATQGWVTAQLRESDAERAELVRSLEALTAVDHRMLLVMDYAETSPELVGSVLETLEARGGHHPVRMVLIARSAGEWWEQLPGATPRSAGVLSGARTVELREIASTSAEREGMYRTAVEALSRRLPALRELPEYTRIDWASVTRSVLAKPYRDYGHGSALHLHMRALLDLLTAADRHTGHGRQVKQAGQAGQAGASRGDAPRETRHETTPEPPRETRHEARHGHREEVSEEQPAARRREPDVQAELLAHERRYWKRTAGSWSELDGLGHDALADAVAVATLTRAADPGRAAELLTLLPDLAGDGRSAAAADWLRLLYPPVEGSHWGALEPDLLGEYHVALRARDSQELLARVLPRLQGREAERALTVLARAAAQPTCPHPDLAAQVAELIVGHPGVLAVPAVVVAGRSENPGFLLDALRRLAERPDLPLELLEHLHTAVPERSRLLGEQALDIAERLARVRRRRARLSGGALAPAQARAELARAEHNLAVRFSSVRRWADAMESSGRAVQLYRGLARARPDEYLPLLAESLGVRWAALSELGQYQEALADCAEAVRVNRRLVAGESGAHSRAELMPHRARLAQALNHLSVVLAARDMRREALTAGEEAVEILEQLVKERPTRRHLALLAGALHNLANRRSPGQSALETVTHAVLIRRRLAQVHPDMYLPGLMESLHNQALELAALGRYSAAGKVVDECLRVTLQLVQDQPVIYRPMVARVLRIRAGVLNKSGGGIEATRTVFRSLLLYRELARERPAEFDETVEATLRQAAWVAWDAFETWDSYSGALRWRELLREANDLAARRRRRVRLERLRETRWPRLLARLRQVTGIRLRVARKVRPNALPAPKVPRFRLDLTVPGVRQIPTVDEQARDQQAFQELLTVGDVLRPPPGADPDEPPAPAPPGLAWALELNPELERLLEPLQPLAYEGDAQPAQDSTPFTWPA
ncbi:trypsin-like peptidase domain-containing protein [Streptomyces sp. NBC_01275]|uniref:tetratricopeptide repeat-containing serine protease family protein n=1 Tax=Streptomyces sp. NBC_01275 TaxID=2903807 RepID=UPI002251770E|nr:tetratricopeptide repeat-containing serine protease family protein [Streptomyces sp. NBC_01275]MCX4765073.1 trypsin-like peptidase domain-containing protein [Streptomyces sp. NBC_01275]